MDTLYIAMELSNKTWKLGFRYLARKKTKVIDVVARDWNGFDTAVQKAVTFFELTDYQILSCYEAGRDGFWIHRGLLERNVTNLVIDSASIEVDRRKRNAKSDGIDVRSLLGLLIRHYRDEDEHVFRTAQVPTRQDEDDRHLHRELEAAKGERTKLSNRIKSLLISQGVEWTIMKNLGEKLETLIDGNGKPLLEGLKMRLRDELDRYQLVDQHIEQLQQSQDQQVKQAETAKTSQIRHFTYLRGIGNRSSWILTMEVFGWRSFKNRKQAGAFPGLTPTPWASGDLSREQGISKAGNARIRWLMVELAWLWVRWQPDSELTLWFNKRVAHAGKRMRRISIVALARKLFIALWRYITCGVVPQGALLKPQLQASK